MRPCTVLVPLNDNGTVLGRTNNSDREENFYAPVTNPANGPVTSYNAPDAMFFLYVIEYGNAKVAPFSDS